MTDRLAELTAGTGISFEDEMVTVDLERGDEDEEVDDETRDALAQYHKEADALSRAIDKIHEKVELIESRYQVTMSEQLDDSDKATAANDIARMLDQTQKTSEAIRKRLRRIAGENKEFAEEYPQKTGELRIRVNTHTGLIRRFMDAMQLFEESQEKHRDNVKSAMERHLRMINPDATDEEIQDALRNGNTKDIIDDSPTLAQLPREEQTRLRRGLADLKSRNNDIKKLEESIIQLHQLFVDMQVMVEAQGELLNDIEYNIGETKGRTEQGLQELVQARAHQKSANRKKICCIVVFLIIVAVVCIPLVLKYVRKPSPAAQEIINNPALGGNGTSTAGDEASSSEESTKSGGEAPPTAETLGRLLSGKSILRLVRSIAGATVDMDECHTRKNHPSTFQPIRTPVSTEDIPMARRNEEESANARLRRNLRRTVAPVSAEQVSKPLGVIPSGASRIWSRGSHPYSAGAPRESFQEKIPVEKAAETKDKVHAQGNSAESFNVRMQEAGLFGPEIAWQYEL